MARKNLVCLMALLWACCIGCKSAVERQTQASETLRATLWEETNQVLRAWLEEMAKTLPTDIRKFPKVKSPLVDWRLVTLQYDWKRPLKSVIARAKHTPYETEFQAILDYFDMMEKFWKKEIEFKDYMSAYKKFKETTSESDKRARTAHMLADFDLAFVHVEAFYGAQDMEGDDRAVYFFRHWQVAFSFPREYHESVSDYLARLCKEKLATYCQDIPFEVMHFAIERPYLEEVQRIANSFVQRYADCPLNRVFGPFLADVASRLEQIPRFKEETVLPDAISKAPFVGHVMVEVSTKGIEYEGTTFGVFSRGFVLSTAALASMAKKIAQIMQRLEEERGPENLEVLVLSMQKDAPVRIAAEVVEVFRKHAPRILMFGARRRAEGVARKTLVGRLEFREVPWTHRRLDIEGVGLVRCKPLGQSVDSQDLPQRIRTVAYLTPDRFVTGKLEGRKVLGVHDADESKGMDLLGQNPLLLLVREDVEQQRFLPLFERLFVTCADEKCVSLRQLNPQVEVQICTEQ